MCLYFVSMNGFARSEEVVTEPALRVSCCMSIPCITLTKDAMFEIAQILKHKHQSIESDYHRNADVLHRSTVVGRGIVSDHCGKHVVVLVGKLQNGGSHQRWIHLDHLVIASDITYIPSIERSGEYNNMITQTKYFSYIRSIGEMNGVWGLDPNVPLTCSHCSYWE